MNIESEICPKILDAVVHVWHLELVLFDCVKLLHLDRYVLIKMLWCRYLLFTVHSFIDSSNIFRNLFYVFALFIGTITSFLIILFVPVKERSFPENEAYLNFFKVVLTDS